MKTPAGDPGDFVLHSVQSPRCSYQRKRRVRIPRNVRHEPLAVFEVGFIGWIVRVRFAFNLDVSFDGSALGVVQPDFSRPSFVIASFIEEGPHTIPTPLKVFQFDPA